MPYIGKKPADIIATVIDTTTGTFSGEVDAGSLDVSGNADIDGITNLDNTDIDGTLDVSGNLTVDTNTLYVDSANNRVGVGTVSPAHALDVNGSLSSNGNENVMRIAAADSTQAGGININSVYGNTASSRVTTIFSIDGQGQDSPLAFGNGTTEAMRIDSSGNVGVGTSSPNRMLSLENGDLQIHETGSSDPLLQFSVGNTQASPTQSFSLRIDNSDSDKFQLINGTSGAIPLTVDTSSNVGIGTSSPSAALHILDTSTPQAKIAYDSNRYMNVEHATIYNVSGAAQSNNLKFATRGYSGNNNITFFTGGTDASGTSESERLRIDSSGRLLLGTTTEGEAGADDLTIATTGHTGMTIRSGTSAECSLFFSDGTSGADEYRGYVQYLHSANALRFGSNSAERMRIDSSGNLLVSKTAGGSGTAGIQLESGGRGGFTKDNAYVTFQNRLSSDGEISKFMKDGTTVGSIGVQGARLTIGNGAVGLSFHGTNGDIYPWNMSTNAINNGGIDLGSAGGRFKDLYLSGGVYLGGTGSANYLDDYEEGSWTPTLVSDSTNPTVTYTVNTAGAYVKVGDIVHLTGRVNTTAVSGGTGNARIGGFPFATGASRNAGALGYISSVTLSAGYTQLGLNPIASASSMRLVQSGSGLGGATVAIGNVGNNFDLTFTHTYKI
jgi:hypothetical protein